MVEDRDDRLGLRNELSIHPDLRHASILDRSLDPRSGPCDRRRRVLTTLSGATCPGQDDHARNRESVRERRGAAFRENDHTARVGELVLRMGPGPFPRCRDRRPDRPSGSRPRDTTRRPSSSPATRGGPGWSIREARVAGGTGSSARPMGRGTRSPATRFGARRRQGPSRCPHPGGRSAHLDEAVVKPGRHHRDEGGHREGRTRKDGPLAGDLPILVVRHRRAPPMVQTCIFRRRAGGIPSCSRYFTTVRRAISMPRSLRASASF